MERIPKIDWGQFEEHHEEVKDLSTEEIERRIDERLEQGEITRDEFPYYDNLLTELYWREKNQN